MKIYYVYQIINTILNKQYIGSRVSKQINDDNYMGSSKYLNEDYEIYGKENFIKKIINDEYKNIDDLLEGEIVEFSEFAEENGKAQAEGGKLAEAHEVFLGISKVSSNTNVRVF